MDCWYRGRYFEVPVPATGSSTAEGTGQPTLRQPTVCHLPFLVLYSAPFMEDFAHEQGVDDHDDSASNRANDRAHVICANNSIQE